MNTIPVTANQVPVFGTFDPTIHKSWMVELYYTYGWDDAAFSVETGGVSKPMRFASPVAAQDEVAEHVNDCQQAVEDGDMEDADGVASYRVVPCEDEPTC